MKHHATHVFNARSLVLIFISLTFLLFNVTITAQTIPGTGSSAGICGNCNPTGWDDANPLLDGTPDISDRNQAGGTGFYGANATWTTAPIDISPTGDVRWITLRDVGNSGSEEENVATTMNGLMVGVTYKLVINSMTTITNFDGGVGNDEPYAGQYIEDFDIQIGSNPRRTIATVTQDVWGTNTIIFIAEATSEVFIIYPGADSNAGNNINDVETVHISVDGLNALQVLDTDGDNVNDTDDIDDDNDGILDTVESGGLDPNGDEDGDGIANYQDVNDDGTGDGSSTDYTDTNSDGYPDAYDFDTDGIPNHLDLDSDNDGIFDNIEAQGTSFVATSGSVGLNGLYDIYEDIDDSGISNLPITDTDTGTGFDDNPDYLDIDSDQDGIPDTIEFQTTTGYIAPSGDVGINGVYSIYENVDTYSPIGLLPVNTDNADMPDYRDTDSDNDTLTDLEESGLGNIISNSDDDFDGLNNNHDTNIISFDATNGIITPATAFTDTDGDVNTGGDVNYRDDVNGIDTDGDKIPDSVDLDDDNDGIPDSQEEGCINQPFGPSGSDSVESSLNVITPLEILDGPNGSGDGAQFNNTSDQMVLRLRENGDIVPNGTTLTITTTVNNTNAKRLLFQISDVNGNNTNNNWNVSYNSTANPTPDQSFTGSGNASEFIINYVLNFDASYIKITMPERDRGRVNIDYVEISIFNICTSDADNDGIINKLDIDADNDGITDNFEAQTAAAFIAKSGIDFDKDGWDDAYDDDVVGGTNGTIIILANTDSGFTNSDTIPDYLDIDSDNDGIPDNIEAQTTTGYVNFVTISGTDKNGMSSAYDFTDNFSSVGLSTTLMNTDSGHPTDADTIPDFRDPDSDGDGTLDENEGLTTITTGTSDADNDGLLDLYENGSTGDGFVVNDGITDPKTTTALIDVDFDASTGGDLDYRDTLGGADTDEDGIVDAIDIDDDNDGILDTVEDVCTDPSIQFQTNPEAYWPLDNTTNDISGNDHDERPLGTPPTFSTNAIQGTHSASFNGINNAIRYSQDGTFMEALYSKISFSAWIQPTSVTGDRIIFEEGAATNGFALWLNNNILTLSVRSGSVQVNVPHPTTLSVDSQWHHVVGTFDEGNINVYLDGVASSNIFAGYTTIPTHSDDGGLGGVVSNSSAGINGYFEGLIDAARYSNSEAWTASQILFENQEICDFDGDGIQNSKDLDADGDGILDIIESQTHIAVNVKTLSGNDDDNDGLDNNFDATPSGGEAGSNGTTPVNTDNGVGFADNPDYLDIDSDQDGTPDNIEAQSTLGYTIPTGNVGLNGVDTAYESNDTYTPTGLSIQNTDENYPTTPINRNPDLIPDYRDTDSDGDGTNDTLETGITYIGSVGADTDGDGLDDLYEGASNSDYDVNDEINDPLNDLLDEDNDGNSIGDVDYRDYDVVLDNDGDGVINSVDLDDDNDGILDVIEGTGDTDSDGVIDAFDIDADNDGIPDNIEAQTTTNYILPNADLEDTYITNDGVNSAYLGGLTPINTDTIISNNADGTPDYLDEDSDGDGINDILENGTANVVSGIDTDADGLDNAFEGGNLNDQDTNDEIDDPTTDLPDEDSDVNDAYVDNGNGADDFNDVDYRDTDDDRIAAIIPGHVLWLRADIGLSPTTWEDQTGTGPTKFDATLNNTPTINTNGINFNPSIGLNGTNQDMSITNGILGNSAIVNTLWIYAVSLRNSGDANIFSQQVNGQVTRFQAPAGTDFSFNPGTGDITNNAWGGTDATFHIWNAGYDNDTGTPPSAQNTTQYRDGLQLATTNNNTGSFNSNNGDATIGSNLGATYMNGEIAEVMVYTALPTALRQQQIQSYLALKYGITLDMTDTDATIDEGDYLLEDLSTIVWDESANSTYHNDVAGIGRDDNMLLTQKQSKSINSDAVITIGLGTIEANNTANSGAINENNSFLVWGNNNAMLTNSTTKVLICATEIQIDRVWKVVETGTIGTVQVAITEATVGAFNVNTILSTPNTIKVLKIADDATFTTNVKHIPVTSVDVNGTNHLVANYDFNGTAYFTYTEINGIFWNGDATSWKGGAGASESPSTIAADVDKILVIDAETSLNNTSVIDDVNVECVWVKPNTKLVISDGHYLQFDEDFVLEGEIRLIGDAQLIQTHSGPSNVQGSGKLYRDQKASVPNVYRYHYWGSPVVAALGNTTYTVSDVLKDGTTPTSESSSPKEINFTTAYDGAPTNPITISNAWINSYFNGGPWAYKGHTGVINVAEGFVMKSTGRAPQNFTFVGTPNDGKITKTLTSNTTSLLGNPYPSVLDAQKFIKDNKAVIDGTLYFWEHKGESSTTTATAGHFEAGYIGGYSQRNETMAAAANSVTTGTAGLGNETYTIPPRYIAVGQGFFVSVPLNKGGDLIFDNTQRLYSPNNILFKGEASKTVIPNLKLGFNYMNSSNIGIHRQIGINFKEGNTFDYESGYDSAIFDLQDTDLYWNFPEIEENLIIAGVSELDAQLQVPISVVIDSDDPVRLMIDEKENMDGYNIYLVDLVTGQIFNLDIPREFNLAKGEYIDRFALVFGGTALGVDEEQIRNKMSIYSDTTNNEIVIKNNNNQIIEKVELYSLLGQKIKDWKNLETRFENRLNTANVRSAVYIVKVFSEKGIVSEKIVISQ